MRTHVTFKTARFNRTEVRPHFINECCFGEDCAAWMVAELRNRGWTDLAEPWQEDWGWQTSGRRGQRKYLLSFGLIPEDEPEWLVHVHESIGILDRLKGAKVQQVVSALAPAIHDVLGSAPDIHDVTWHYEDEFTRGRSIGAADPTVPRNARDGG